MIGTCTHQYALSQCVGALAGHARMFLAPANFVKMASCRSAPYQPPKRDAIAKSFFAFMLAPLRLSLLGDP